jgi:hypothetical protein
MAPAPTAAKASAAGAKVIVASKLEHALELQLSKFSEVRVPDGRGGYFMEKQSRKVGKIYTINGTAYPIMPPEGYHERPQMQDGCALTFGIPKEFWDEWKTQYAGFPALESGLIFASEKGADVKAKAREKRDVKSDLSPMMPARPNEPIKDPRVDQPLKGFPLKVFGTRGPTDLDTAA